MNYVKLIFDLAHPDDADILSALLNDMDCQGIEENDTQLLVFRRCIHVALGVAA